MSGDRPILPSLGTDAAPSARRAGRSRHGVRKKSRLPGCLIALTVIALLGVGLYVGLSKGASWLSDRFAAPEDYPGPGKGQVLVEVREGDNATDIGSELKSAGVVKSIEAFTAAAAEDPASTGIQVGFYRMKKQMKAGDALKILVNPDNLIQHTLTIPEGFRTTQIVDRIAEETPIKKAALERALDHPSAIGLPAAANGNPEGYLFPATYPVAPNETAVSLLSAMVAKTAEIDSSLNLTDRAAALDLTPAEVMTMASILEYEGYRDQDLPKIARVFYNRLDQGMPLQSDATVAYAAGVTGTIWTTPEQRRIDSPYNTYRYPGLPPGPIGAPGERTLEAALNPADGDWLYFVPVNLDTGETAFASTFAEHKRNVDQLRQWCAENDSENCL